VAYLLAITLSVSVSFHALRDQTVIS